MTSLRPSQLVGTKRRATIGRRRKPCIDTCWLLFAVGLLLLTTGRASAQVTTVYCHFTSADGSYANSEEAAKAAELTQVLLQAEPEIVFVERTLIDQMLKELGNQSLGSLDPSLSLKVGRWLKADLLIKGVFSWNESEGWRLDLELIDLHRADVVAQYALVLHERSARRFEANELLAGRIAQRVLRLLPEAAAAMEQADARILVAPLHFQNTHPNRRLDFLEADLKEAFASRNRTQQERRYLQFARAEEAFTEADLINSRVVEADRDRWRRIADYYVWGSYQEVESSGVPFDEVRVSLNLSWWDGAANRGQTTVRGTVGDRESLLKDAIEEIERIGDQKQQGEIDDRVRTQIADAFYQRAISRQVDTLQAEQQNSSEVTERWLRLWRQTKRLLSVAAFFDPSSEKIRRELLIETTRDDLSYTTFAGNNELMRLVHRSRLWEERRTSFGLDFELQQSRKFPEIPGSMSDNRLFAGSGVVQYLDSLEDVLALIAFELTPYNANRRQTDVPTDLLERWRSELTQEYLERVRFTRRAHPKWFDTRVLFFVDAIQHLDSDIARAELLELIWPAVLENRSVHVGSVQLIVRRVYEKIDQPEEGERLLTMLESKRASNGPVVRGVPPSRPVKHAGPLEDLATRVDLPMRGLPIEPGWLLHDVSCLTHAGESVWCGVEGDGFRERTRAGNGLFTVSEAGRWEEREDINRLACRTTSMLEHDGRLWVTFVGDDLASLEINTGEVRRYTARSGAPSNALYAACVSGDKLFFGGGSPSNGVLGSMDPDSLEWRQYDLGEYQLDSKSFPVPRVLHLAADADWVAVYAAMYGSFNQILLLNIEKGARIDAGERLRLRHPEFSHFTSSWRPEVNGMAFVDGTVWIATSRGLLAFDPTAEKFTYVESLPCELTGIEGDGNQLWLTACPFRGNGTLQGAELHTAILLFDTVKREWLSQTPLTYPGHITAIDRHDDTLWIGMQGQGHVAIEVDVATLRKNHQGQDGKSRDVPRQ